MKINASLKKALTAILPFPILNWLKKIAGKAQVKQWEKDGHPLPPPHMVKQLTIAEYRQKFDYDTLVETGTYMGDMVQAQKKRFKQVISIELGEELFEKAKKRFRKDDNVILMQGDSGKVLSRIVKDLKNPAIFWLDGHYSGGITAKGEKDCPIFEEVNAILENDNFNHVLLIDDARCFVGDAQYPSIDLLTQHVQAKNNKYKVEVKNDIIIYSH